MKILGKKIDTLFKTPVDFVITYPVKAIKGLFLLAFFSALLLTAIYLSFLFFKFFVLLFFYIFLHDPESKSIPVVSLIVMIVFGLILILIGFWNFYTEKINEIKELKEGEASIFIYWWPCPDCGGQGCFENKLDDYQASETVACNLCNGSGEHNSGTKSLHPRKTSSGTKYLAQCPKCMGSGSILDNKDKKVHCKTCRGKGRVYSAKSDENVS
jgi:ribosomal protein S27E